MKTFLSILLTFSGALIWAQNSPLTVEGTLLPGISHERNFVKNPGAEINVNYLTQSGAITTRSTSTPLQGKAHFSINATASAQTVKFDTWTLDTLLKGQNCEARFVFTGDASLYKAYVEQGSTKVTSDLALANAANSQTVSINFPCGDLSSNSHLVVESTGDGAAISVDAVYLGQATNLSNISQASFYGGMTIPGGEAGCSFSENGSSGLTNFADLGTGSGCSAWTTYGAATAQATNDHRIVFNNMPPGEYLFDLSGSPEVNASGLCSWRLSDGTNVSEGFLSASLTYAKLSFRMSYTSPGSRTFKIQAADNQASGCAWGASTSYPKIGWSVYRFPTSSELALTTNCVLDGTCLNNFSAKISASGVVSQENVNWINGNCTAADPTVCTFNTSFFSTPPNCTMTVINASTALVTHSTATTATTGSFKMTNSSTGGSATNDFYLSCNRQGTDLKPQANAPIFVGSVTSGSSGAERIERARVFVANAGSAITSQSGTWLTAIANVGTGSATLTMTGFLSSPHCVCSNLEAYKICSINVTSATSAGITTINTFTNAPENNSADIICMGPK